MFDSTQLLHCFEAVHSRHAHIKNHQIGKQGPDDLKRRGSGIRFHKLIVAIAQDALQSPANVFFVINDQDQRH